jgi:hypothetical protein
VQANETFKEDRKKMRPSPKNVALVINLKAMERNVKRLERTHMPTQLKQVK